jgi:hypothetical protein
VEIAWLYPISIDSENSFTTKDDGLKVEDSHNTPTLHRIQLDSYSLNIEIKLKMNLRKLTLNEKVNAT